MLETHCADKALLICDEIEIGSVDYAVAVRTGEGRATASGYLVAAPHILDACRRAAAVVIVSRHLGPVMIHIASVSGEFAEFSFAEGCRLLEVEPACAPPCIMPAEPIEGDALAGSL
jgi:hypothetical protein